MLEEPATNGISQHRRIGLILRALRFEWGRVGIDARDGGEAVPRFDAIRRDRDSDVTSPLWESIGRLWRPFWKENAEAKLRLCRIDRCDPGEGLRSIDRPRPLTPTLSHKGRGGAPPPVQVLDSIFKQPKTIQL
jgi:hypothetical protein